MIRHIFCFSIITVLTISAAVADDDPYLWLEQVQDEKALNWVRGQNSKTFEELRENKS